MKQINKYFFSILFVLLFSLTIVAQNNRYVVLISFDGFRWDYANRGITPNFDYVKENGVHAISLKPCFPSKTFPNHYSIVTGMYPENHGIIANSFVDPTTKEKYSIGDTSEVRKAKWYRGEAIWETARRQGMITASYFWPGSELNLDYRRPNYYEKYEHERNYDIRIKEVLDWLSLPYAQKPKFITMYFDATDTYGHEYGPDSKEVNSSIMRLDSVVGKIFDGLKKINLFDSTDIIIVSDHGMVNVSKDRIINVEKILNGIDCKLLDNGPFMYAITTNGQLDNVYKRLKANENHYKIYKKEEMPAFYHFSKNYLIPELILIADPGWSLMTENDIKTQSNETWGGNHGYDNNYIDMQGIFYAIGPDFKNGYICGTLQNIDIYPLIAKLLKIVPNNEIDGKIENIEFILK
jgi:ectonucleotide pyrophosphatase/phosphodiesterase family protein 5